MSEPLWQPRTDLAARLLGAGFFAFGVGLIGFQIKTIRDAAAEGAERVSYFLSAFALGEMAILLGLFWLVRGLAGYTAVRTLQTNPQGMRTLMIVSAVIIGATLFGVQEWLATLGFAN